MLPRIRPALLHLSLANALLASVTLLWVGCGADPAPVTSPPDSGTQEPTGPTETLPVTPTTVSTATPLVTPVVTPTATLTPPTPSATPATPSPTPTGPTPSSTPVDNDLDDDGYTDLDGDCDDSDPDTYPGAQEFPYDGVDQDCQGGDLVDVDKDGYAATQAGGSDCDDSSANTHPGADEFEDDLDNDCDGQIDEDLNTNDDDGDGFSEATGDCDDQNPDKAPNLQDIPYDGIDQDCSGTDLVDIDQDGFEGGEAGSDCNDTDANLHPGAPEIPYDGIDQNCVGGDLVDQDGDGAEGGPDGIDCDDLDPSRSPLLVELPYDGIDQDCSGADLVDVDQDGQPSTQVGGPDCDDASPSSFSGAVEVPYDGIDQDCSGQDLVDVDGDGHPSTQVSSGDDCDDTAANTYPGAEEFEDDKDNDCDGRIDEDLNTNDDDGDGFTEATGDCDDTAPATFPGATELPYDGIDQDCSGLDLIDVDGDTYPGGEGSDCNDTNPYIFPTADEIPYDTIDQDCSGQDLTDVDGDGFDAEAVGGTDCDDTSGLTFPGAAEVPYDAIDQDCSGEDLIDVDGDGFASTLVGGEDCNDGAPAIHPDAAEVCDGLDNNCDAVVDLDAVDRSTWYVDADGDTYGDPTRASLICTPASNQVSNSLDCNDGSSISYPGAVEVCDTLDNNCDTQVDEGVESAFFADTDGDLYGNANESVLACDAPPGYVEDFTDCDDQVSTTFPTALETCNDVDDNCDDQVDEGVLISFYPDEDGDGFGVTEEEVQLCASPAGYVETPGDCDDLHASAYPGGSEVCDAENVDEDCDGAADDSDTSVDVTTKTTWYRDTDGDSYGSDTVTTTTCDMPSGYVAVGGDCNAANPAIHPGATEGAGDSIDQNCDGAETCFADADDDGYRPNATATVASADKDCLDAAEATQADPLGDCDDQASSVNPGATEVTGDSIDQSCDGTEICFKDADDDGYRPDATSTTASSDADCADAAEAAASDPTGDCNDADPAMQPAATELAGDSIDQNCDGVEMCFTDADNDGYRPNTTSTTGSADTDCADTAEATASDPTGDCNDGNAAVKPGVAEVTGDSTDQNCDGVEACFKDADDDGYRPDATSTTPSGDSDCADATEATASDPTGDCNDGNAAVKPGVAEVAGDATDQNCDGAETCFTDADDDGYRPDATSTTASSDTDCADAAEATASDPTGDCNDGNAAVKPGVAELTGDSIDQNCDGLETCFKDADDDGYRPDATSTTASLNTSCADAAEATLNDPTGDCNDGDATIKPGKAEVAGDSIDQNCDGAETCFKDADNDGYRPDTTSTTASTDTDCADTAEATATDPSGDCNDASASVKPGASETLNGVDDNCNGQTDEGLTPASCAALKSANPSATSGAYTIDPDGAGSTAAFQVYCEMTLGGGGWTLVAKFTNQDSKNWINAATSWTGTNTYGATNNLNAGADAKGAGWGTVTATEFMLTDNQNIGSSKYIATTGSCVGGRTLSAFFTAALSGYPSSTSLTRYKTCTVSRNFVPVWAAEPEWGSNGVTSTNLSLNAASPHVQIAAVDSTDTSGVISTYAEGYNEVDVGLGAHEDKGFSTTGTGQDIGGPTSCSYSDAECASEYPQTVFMFVK